MPSGGLDEPSHLSSPADALNAIKAGRAAFERDSVLFHEPAVPFHSPQRFTLRGQSGTENAVDLIFTLSYD